jgi:hypothetical protein
MAPRQPYDPPSSPDSLFESQRWAPTSAPTPTHIGTTAEPVPFFSFSLSSFLYTYTGYSSRPRPPVPIEARRAVYRGPSGIFVPRSRLFVADGSTVALTVDRPS